MPITFAEYIWIDGSEPTPKLRSKTKSLQLSETTKWEIDGNGIGIPELQHFPDWGFDGSSTNQATGSASDCALRPVFVCIDPVREGVPFEFEDGSVSVQGATRNFLVMCEVFNADGTPHATNARAKLRELIGVQPGHDKAGSSLGEKMMQCWFGLEQEYTLFKGSRPLGFPDNGYPSPQGPYYCGVGDDEVSGRPLVEAHMKACAESDLRLAGVNAEVMPGQWEFQIGPSDPLEVGDHLWIARWLLYRLGEDHGINASLDQKPVRGDWNGAGMHTNFSTGPMRKTLTAEEAINGKWGLDAITDWCEEAGKHVEGHLAAYGAGIEQRLTGAHETCRFDVYKYGTSDRTASIRIPMQTAKDGYGYLEDRRPGANADPYAVAAVMLKTAFRLW